MANSIKYSTGSETLALKKGNFYIGTGDVGKGPTSGTSYYNGVTPPSSGYTIYTYTNTLPGNLSYFTASSDTQLVNYTNNLLGTSYTSATQCLVYFGTQTDKMVLNRDYNEINTSGLTFITDAGFTPSYPKSGVTFYDLSGNNINGQLINGVSYNDGGYLQLDGTDDYISYGDATALKTSAFTAQIIFNPGKLNYLGDSSVLMGINDGINWRYGWTINIYNGIVRVSVNNFNTYELNFTGVSLNINYCLSITFDGSNLSAYLNGMYQSTTTASLAYQSTNKFQQGWALSYDNTSYFQGRIYNSMIYNRALSSIEVLKNYQAVLPIVLDQNIVSNSLILYLDASYRASYPTTGTNWFDSSGISNNGILYNGPTYTSEFGGGIVFDGSDDYVGIPYNSTKISFPTNNATICVWFKTKTGSDNTGALMTQRGVTLGGFQTYVFENKFYADGGGTFGVYSTTTIVPGTVYFACAVYDRTNQKLKLYINGNFESEVSYTNNIQDQYQIKIGGSYFSDGPLPGTIYAAYLYNDALTSAQILQNYNAQKGRFGL